MGWLLRALKRVPNPMGASEGACQNI